MSRRTTLKSANTAVIISDSPAFKSQNDSGYIFASVQSLSYGFNTVRANNNQIGSQDFYDENIVRQPDVNLQMSYSFTPTFANEELLGLSYNLDAKSKYSVIKDLKDSSYNFYIYNHPDQGFDGLGYIKSGTSPNGGEVVSIGNAYLTNYSINFALGTLSTVDVEFDCSNIKIENYVSDFIESPAINLESGNNVGVGQINLLDSSYYEPDKFGEIYNLDRSKIETILPHDINFQMDNLSIGGQKLELENHRINQFSIQMPIGRSNSYRLGSDYVCNREMNYPVNCTLSISSLVTNLEAGFISGLVEGDEISNLRIISTDCQKQITSQFYFEDIKLENIEYQTLVNEQTNYNLEFSFQITDKKGFKTAVSEQDIRDTRFIDSGNRVYRSIRGDVTEGWVSGDLGGYKVAFGEVFDYDVLNAAFADCINIDKPVFLPEQINSMGDDVFNGCINLPDFYSDSTCRITSLGERCFKDCSSLEEIVLPVNIQTVKEECFMGCSSAQNLFLQNVVTIEDRAFYNCSGLSESLYLPDSLTSLGESAFENCSGMEGGLYISKSLTTINDKTFKNAKLLSFDLIIPDNITSIGHEAFYGCEGFDGDLYLSSGLSTIEDYTFYGCDSLQGNLFIPENVTEIKISAFEGCSGFNKEILLPNVEIIAENAFSGCSSLTGKLSFGSGILSIGDNAFMGCDSFGYSLTIPSGVQSIGDRSFSGCFGIKDVYVNFPHTVFQGSGAFEGIQGCMYVTPFYYNGYIQNSIDGFFQGMPVCYGSLDTIVFDANTAEVIQFKRGDIPSGWFTGQSRDSLLVIGSTCKNIEPYAFTDSYGLGGLFVVPKELETIGDFAFKGCSFEGELVIPDTIQYLGSGAFENCSGFDDILDIGDGIDTIKGKTFKNCSSINGDIILNPEIIRVEEEAFYNCSSVSGDIFLSPNLIYIGDYAFYNCQSAVGDLELPEDLVYLGDYAFYNCFSLDGEFISIEANEITYIGNYALQNCSLLTGPLILPPSLTYLGSGAFKNCSSLDGAIDLTETKIDEIYEETFFGCSGLIDALVIPDPVLAIGDRAFKGCVGLNDSITITNIAARNIGVDAFDSPLPFVELIVSDFVTEISQYEFDYFKNDPLYLTLQEGLTGINDYSFSNYNFIGDLDIPLTLRSVGYAAFSGCTFGGTYLFEDSNMEYIGDYAFYDLNLINGNIDIPNVEYIGDGAFYNNSSIDGYISFGPTLGYIGEYAFANCSSAVGDLIIPDFVSGVGQYAFLNCSSLSGAISLPNNENYNYIKTGTFKNCSLLSGDLLVHDSISGIETEAFLGCSNLDGDITITDVCASTLIGTNAFDDSPFARLIISDSVINVDNGEFDYFASRSMEVVFQEGLSGILNNAFDNYNFVGELDFPLSLSGIGDSAFQNCVGFSGSLTIPEDVIGIGQNAFRSCSNLSGNLIIPSLLSSIGDGAFVDCVKLDGYIRISDLSASSISSYINVFGGTNFTELRATSSDLIIEDTEFDGFDAFVGRLVIEDSALEVGDYAFVDNFSFADTLTISENSERIGDYAFSGNNFTGDLFATSEIIGFAAFAECVDFDGEFSMNPITVNIVEDYAFYNCSNLSGNLILPESLVSIGDYSFYNMNSLNGEFKLCELDEEFEGILTEYDDGDTTTFVTTSLQDFGDYAFANNSGLSGNLVIPDTVTQWGEYAFLNMSSLDGFLILGSGVNTIPQGIFKNCSGVTCYSGVFEIHRNVTDIGAEAFYNCASLSCALKISNDVNVGLDAFYGTNFGALIIPSYVLYVNDGDYDYLIDHELNLVIENGVQEIRFKAFDDYSFIGSLNFPNSITLIGESGFKNCDGFIGDLSIPSQVDIISESAFENCSGFDGELDLGNNITGIEDKAFANCLNFTGDLIIPNSVSGIGIEAFLNCSGFDGDIQISNNVDYLGDSIFENCINITGELELPGILTGIGEETFRNCSNLSLSPLNVLEIPRYVESIGARAFQNCTNLLSGFIQIGTGVEIGQDAFDPFNFKKLIVPDWVTIVSFGDYEYFKNYQLGLAFENYTSSLSQTTVIGSGAFSDYNFTGDIVFPRNLLEIRNEAFKNCDGFVGDLSMSINVNEIFESAFENCSGFDGNLSLNSTILSIGERAFANCSSFIGDINIPNNFPTELGAEAFINCTGFDGTIVIGNKIKDLKDRTFQNCRNITGHLVLHEEISGIGEATFKDCVNMTNDQFGDLEIPKDTDVIGDSAFENCFLLLTGGIKIKGGVDIGQNALEPFNFERLIVPDYVTSISSGDYEYFESYPLQLEFENYNNTSLQKTTAINQKAFSGYNLAGTLDLPIKLQQIGDAAFVNLDALEGDLRIRYYLQNIGEQAFENCSGFDGEFSLVDLPVGWAGQTNLSSSLTSIGDYAFANCTNWSGNLVIPDGASYGEYAFLNNNSLDGFLILNETLSVIPEGAFQDCSGLKCYNGVFKIPEAVTVISRYAFKNCVSLNCELQISPDAFISTDAFAGIDFNGLVIPKYVTEVSNGDYDYFDQEQITLKFEDYNSLSSETELIGSGAFDNYNFVSELNLPRNLTGIGDRAFYQNDGLYGPLTIPTNVRAIGESAFENCSGFYGNFSLPGGIVDIGSYAFKNCKDLYANLALTASARTIGDEAFANCISLDGQLVLPYGITDIGSGAFLNASGIDGVLITSLPPTVFKGENAFSGVGGVLELSPLIYQSYENLSTNINGDYYFQGIKISGQVADDTIFYTGQTADEALKVEEDRLTSQNFQPYAVPDAWKEGLTSDPDFGGINTQQQYCWLDMGGLCDAISIDAFANRKQLRGQITFVDSILSINDRAFLNCENLESIVFAGNSLQNIEEDAFRNCKNISNEIILPSSLYDIKPNAFRDCRKADGLTILDGNNLTTISGYTFWNFGYDALNSVYKLNEGLEYIYNNAFRDAGGIGASLELPSTLKHIGYECFYSFGNGNNPAAMGELKGIDASSSLEFMDWFAFRYARLTGNLVFPSSLSGIPYYGFAESYINSVSGFDNMDYIGDNAFQESKIVMDELTIGSKPSLGGLCFNQTTIRNLTLAGNRNKDSFDYRGSQFNNAGLQNLTIEGSEYLPYGIFENNPNLHLESNTFNDVLSGIEDNVFSNIATNYTDYFAGKESIVNLPSGLKLIGNNAFSNNYNMRKLDFSGSASGLVIGYQAFANIALRNIGTYYVSYEPGPRSLATTYRSYPESNVSGEFVIPSGLRYLGTSAFYRARGRNLDVIFSDDFVESEQGITYQNPSNGQYLTRGYWAMNSVFQEATLNKLHLSSGMKILPNSFLQDFIIMDHNNFDSPLGITGFNYKSCFGMNCESGNGTFTFEFGSGLQSIGNEAFATNGVLGYAVDSDLPFHYWYGAKVYHRCIEAFDFSRVSGAVDFGNSCFRNSWMGGTLELPVVNSLGNGVFEGADNLEGVVFQSSPNITNLSDETFANMASLSGVVFNPELTSIGNSVFENCPSLIDFDISATSVGSLGNTVFKNCTNLANINLENGSLTTLGNNVFENCTSIDDLYVPNSVTTVGSNLFLNANINILDYDVNTTVLDPFLFNFATIGDLSLPQTTITVREGVFANATFGPDPFDGLPNSVVTFENSIFLNTTLSGIIIPTSLSGLANTTFKGGANLTGLDFSLCTALTGIGNENFMDCTSMDDVILPNSLEVIGDRNFKNINTITEITFPNSLEVIGDENFVNCSGLAYVDLSNTSLREMGSRNFIEDTNIKTIYALLLPDTLEVIGDENFKEMNVDTLELPSGLRILGDSNFYDCQPSNNGIWGEGDPPTFVIPSGIESIGNSNWERSDGIQRLTISQGFSGSIGDLNWNLCNQISKIFIKTVDSNFSIGSGNFKDLNLLSDVEIDCPASCWQGLDNFEECKTDMRLYINSAHIGGYNATWSGDQKLPNGAEIISYSP